MTLKRSAQVSNNKNQSMQFAKSKNSIERDYFFIALTIIVAIIGLSLNFSVIFYFDQQKQNKLQLVSAANHIDTVLTDSFDYTTNIMKLIGTKVVSQNANDIRAIVALLSEKFITNTVAKNYFSITVFDWVTSQRKMIVSGPHGVLKKPIDVSFREYSKFADKQPWKLNFDLPSKGVVSGQYIIPAGMGITNKDNKFLGIVTVGFSPINLSNNIEKEIDNSNIKFVILSNNYSPVLGSTNARYISPDDNFFREKLANKGTDGFLKTPIIYDNVKYIYCKKLNKYPYVILAGFNKEFARGAFLSVLMPRITELLCLGIITIIILLVTRRKIVNPVLKLAKAADQISRGSVVVDIPKFELEEMSSLSQQLDNVLSYTNNLRDTQKSLKDALRAEEDTRKQLALANVSLEKKVSERTQELEQALTVKTEFLNNMSHEIRTPIQGVSGISDGLVEHWKEFDDERKFVLAKKIKHNARRLFSLVGNLLDISKFTAGKILLKLQEVNMNTVIKEMIDECDELYIGEKNIKIEFKKSKLPLVILDKERMIQVLRNLFINAVKFSTNNSIITVSAIRDSEKNVLHFAISDRGVGIPEGELDSIFESFTQSSKTKTKAGGAGLGLTICKEIITAHHGQIWAENNKDGGATLHFVVPASLSESDLKEENNEASNLIVKPLNILMIDDEDACLTSMELLLHGSHYKLIKVSSGRAGLNYLQHHFKEIDVVLLDLMLPDMYGLNILSSVQENPELAQIPVILQSGTSDEAEIKKAFELGVCGYIKKPYHKELVLDELAKATALK